MERTELTTVQTDKETLRKLRELAQANERSTPGQLRWLVNWEYEKWQKARALEAAAEKAAKREGRSA